MIWPTLTELECCSVSSGPARITGASSPVSNLAQYTSGADLDQEAGIQRLNILTEMVDRMSVKGQHLLSGALDAWSVNELDDVLRAASSLGQYEFIAGVTTVHCREQDPEKIFVLHQSPAPSCANLTTMGFENRTRTMTTCRTPFPGIFAMMGEMPWEIG